MSSGVWVRPPAALRDGPARACACCGRPLFGRAWRVQLDGEELELCEPECERLYREYVLPRYGARGERG